MYLHRNNDESIYRQTTIIDKKWTHNTHTYIYTFIPTHINAYLHISIFTKHHYQISSIYLYEYSTVYLSVYIIFYIYHNHISLGKIHRKPMAFRTAACPATACPKAPARWSNAPRRPWRAWLRKAAPAEDLIWLNQWTLYEAYDFNWLYNYKKSGRFPITSGKTITITIL